MIVDDTLGANEHYWLMVANIQALQAAEAAKAAESQKKATEAQESVKAAEVKQAIDTSVAIAQQPTSSKSYIWAMLGVLVLSGGVYYWIRKK